MRVSVLCVCVCVLCVISSLTQLTNFVLAVLALFKYRFSQRYDWVFQIWPQAKLRISHFNPPHSTPSSSHTHTTSSLSFSSLIPHLPLEAAFIQRCFSFVAHFPFHKAAIEPAVYDLGLQQSHSKKELELQLEMELGSGLELGVGSCWWSCLLAAASVRLGLASGLP